VKLLGLLHGLSIARSDETGLDGLNLDVEEAMSLPSIIRLTNRQKHKGYRDFLATLAPRTTAIRGAYERSRLHYEASDTSFLIDIAWYNTQIYGDRATEDGSGLRQ